MAVKRYGDAYYKSLQDFVTERQPQYGLEIGTEEGDSAEAFLSVGHTSKLVCIDPQNVSWERLQSQFGDRHIFIQGFSPEAMEVVKKRQFDWIYIDGDHSYEAVAADIKATWPLLKPAGTMVFDDYGNPCGVKQAVDEFAASHNLTVTPVPNNPHGAVWISK